MLRAPALALQRRQRQSVTEQALLPLLLLPTLQSTEPLPKSSVHHRRFFPRVHYLLAIPAERGTFMSTK